MLSILFGKEGRAYNKDGWPQYILLGRRIRELEMCEERNMSEEIVKIYEILKGNSEAMRLIGKMIYH